MQNKNKMICFDLDGVVIDSVALMTEQNKKEFPDITEDQILQISYGNIFDFLENSGLEKCIETEEEREARVKKYYAEKEKCGLYGGIPELLQELHEKYIITANTSSSVKTGVKCLCHNQILRHFDFVATKELSKNKVEKFQILSEQYGISPENILFITDTVGDLREAEQAKVKTLFVSYGALPRYLLEKEVSEYCVGIVDSPGEIGEWIEENF